MDFSNIVTRTKAILVSPRSEWPVIAAETTTVKDLFLNYLVWLAAIPVVCGFIKGSIIGYSAFGVTVRSGIASGIGQMIVSYVIGLALIYVLALIVNALAPTFQAKADPVQALKAVGYAYTATWVAGIGLLIPYLGWLIAIAGAIYGIYLLYLGLPATMQCPPEKAGGYTAVTVVLAIVFGWLLAILVGGVFGAAHLSHAALGMAGHDASTVTVKPDSTLGKLDAIGKRMAAASDKMEAAQKSGDPQAAHEALGTMMGAMAGSDGAITAIAPDELKALLPARLGGLARTSISAQRQGAMGIQTADAKAEYAADGSPSVTIQITDTAGAKALLAMANAFGVERDAETAQGFDKSWQDDGRSYHAQWDKANRSGEYTVVVGNRFVVSVEGGGESIDTLKDALGQVDLARLEGLKDQGVQHQ